MPENLPFSQACENNKNPILAILRRHLRGDESVLEIAGGTGQHCVYFTENFPELKWQSSDIPSNVKNLNLRINSTARDNLPAAIPLDVNQPVWNCPDSEIVFTANSLHIMSARSVENLFRGLDQIGNTKKLFVYGPFKYDHEFTTDSNANFDLWLKEQNAESGIRDFEWVCELASGVGLTLLEDNVMPANNQLLVWHR
jgi:hypothetical protein